MSEPTRGPWEWSGGRLFRDNRPEQMSSSTILAIQDQAFRPNDADSSLIAAAPEMLAAIESLNTLLGAPDLEKNEARWDDAMEEVEAELARVAAKARGESRQ